MTPEEYDAIASKMDSEAADPSLDQPEDQTNRKKSQADALVRFTIELFDLLHDKNGDAYAREKSTGEVRRLGGTQFKYCLFDAFYRAKDQTVREQSWREAAGTLEALARHAGSPQEVSVRVAAREAIYYIDLAHAGCSEVVELSAGGWRIIEQPPVLFVRGESMQPLPYPIRGGSIEPLWRIANVPESQRLLVLAWLIDAMRPDTPYPGLELIGEQGSGKSTTADALRRLIDPNACNLRNAPKSTEDIFVGACHNHLVAYENVSHLSGPIQDALAILSTGGGFAKRQLYTDSDEHVISVCRPWLVNGISISVTQQDLVDRVVSIECPVIDSREPSARQKSEFEEALPGILGGLLDIAARALAELPSMVLAREDRPRMLEYVLLGMAVARSLGQDPDHFRDLFASSRKETVARTIDASPVAGAVLAFVEDSHASITATTKEFLLRLEKYKPVGAGDTWPRSPKGLGDALRRAAPALRQVDVEVRCLGNIGGHVKWVIGRKSRTECHPCHEVIPRGLGATPPHDFMTSMISTGELLGEEQEGRI